MNGDIEVGSTVRYTNTGTIGKVKKFEERDHETWALVDSTGMWYNTEALELLGAEVEKKEWNKELSLEDLKRLEERKLDSISHAQQILEAELCESGG